ncbi:MAG: RHS repeat-associated core domain-containing protein [Thermoanaerobaculaceae bacterium]
MLPRRHSLMRTVLVLAVVVWALPSPGLASRGPTWTLPHDDAPVPAARHAIWDTDTLVAEMALESTGVPLWKATHLPGPGGLDDTVVLRLDTNLLSTAATAHVALVRDEMGSVIALARDDPDGGAPRLVARVLYTPYGEAHLETGPEPLEAKYDPAITTLDNQQQQIQLPAQPGDPVTAAPGGVWLRTTSALDPASVAAGLSLVMWNQDLGLWEIVPPTAYVAKVEPVTVSLRLMPLAGWTFGARYEVRYSTALTDPSGRALQVPPAEPAPGDHVRFAVAVAADGTVDAQERRWTPEYDSAAAAGSTLGGLMPGGTTTLFQGLWVDPVTGQAHARARVLDTRHGVWLSEDPLELDSPNLYAFVAWQPQMYLDPMGTCLGLDDVPCSVYQDEIARQYSSPREVWGSAKRSGRFALFELKGAALAVPRAVKGVYEVATHPVDTLVGAYEFGESVVSDLPGSVQRFGNALMSADPDSAGEFVGESLFWVAAGGAGKAADSAAALQKARQAVAASRAQLARFMSESSLVRGQFLEDVFQARKIRQGASVFETKAGRVGIDLSTVEDGATWLNEVKFVKGRVSAGEISSFGLKYPEYGYGQQALARNIRRALRGATRAELDPAIAALRTPGGYGVRLVGGPRTVFDATEIASRLGARGITNVVFERITYREIARYILRGGRS